MQIQHTCALTTNVELSQGRNFFRGPKNNGEMHTFWQAQTTESWKHFSFTVASTVSQYLAVAERALSA